MAKVKGSSLLNLLKPVMGYLPEVMQPNRKVIFNF